MRFQAIPNSNRDSRKRALVVLALADGFGSRDGRHPVAVGPGCCHRMRGRFSGRGAGSIPARIGAVEQTDSRRPGKCTRSAASDSPSLAQDHADQAFELISQWIESHGQRHALMPEVQLLRGDCQVAKGDYYKALFDYEVVIRQYPASSQYLRGSGEGVPNRQVVCLGPEAAIRRVHEFYRLPVKPRRSLFESRSGVRAARWENWLAWLWATFTLTMPR